MSRAFVLDVSALPTYAYGHRSMMWWSTMLLALIEGTAFAIALGTYFYLRNLADQWPPLGNPPGLLYGSVNTVIMLLSVVPNHLTKKAAQREDLRKVRRWLLVCLVFAVAFLVVRVFEYRTLNTHWYDSAYGSIVFALLTLHTTHLVTDFIDSTVLTVLMFTGPLEGRRYVDVSESADYWYFVVFAWVPIWLTIYLAPRL
jgi:heme/copper-type cytochrome/quinol oxidase subunit 3